jgi:hypothetical protein
MVGKIEWETVEADVRHVARSNMDAKRHWVDTRVTVMPGRSSWRRPIRRRKVGMWLRARKGKRTTCSGAGSMLSLPPC